MKEVTEGFSGLPRAVFEERIRRMQREVQAGSLDAAFVFSDEYRPGNTMYFSDYKPINVIEESPQGVYIPPDGDPVVFLGGINAQAARRRSWVADIRDIETVGDFFADLRNPGKRLRLGLVGKALLPVKYYEMLLRWIQVDDIIDFDDALIKLRSIKSKEEVDLMQRAAEIGDDSIREAIALLRGSKSPVSENDLAARGEYIIRACGADIGSATVLSAGLNTAEPTWRPTTEKLIDLGDAVLIDMNPAFRGYCSDVSVTVFHGKVDGVKAEASQCVKDILSSVVTKMKPGMPASFVFDYFRAGAAAHGFEKHFLQYAKGMRAVGHGVGMDIVERPNLSAESAFLLEPGMTLALKLDLHGFDFGGIRMEADCVVEQNGCRYLNRILDEDLLL